jgi:hypothetical protein
LIKKCQKIKKVRRLHRGSASLQRGLSFFCFASRQSGEQVFVGQIVSYIVFKFVRACGTLRPLPSRALS